MASRKTYRDHFVEGKLYRSRRSRRVAMFLEIEKPGHRPGHPLKSKILKFLCKDKILRHSSLRSWKDLAYDLERVGL